MTTIYTDRDASPSELEGCSVAVVGYGNQGRSWAMNLRDSGLDPTVCVRADETREQAAGDGFPPGELADADTANVVCVLVPDDAIPSLPLRGGPEKLFIVASGYSLAFDRFSPEGDLAMVAPRMLGPEVRRCYLEGVGFISAVGVHRDASGSALPRALAVAQAIGGLSQGALALTPKQEAVLDLAVEQVLSPALTHVNQAFVLTMLQQGIPMEAIMTELVLSGEVERNYRILREIGFADQLAFHSPTSQYGQLSRRGFFDSLDFAPIMKQIAENIASGGFAEEWDAEAAAGHPRLEKLREQHAGPAIREMEANMRRHLGPSAGQDTDA